jgi:hypothetical protein
VALDVGGLRAGRFPWRAPDSFAGGWLADHLRRRHLLSDVPWSAMAVIVVVVRGRGQSERAHRWSASSSDQ